MSKTDRPSRCSHAAAQTPTMPAPMTTTGSMHRLYSHPRRRIVARAIALLARRFAAARMMHTNLNPHEAPMIQRFRQLAHWGAFTAVVEDGILIGCEPF